MLARFREVIWDD